MTGLNLTMRSQPSPLVRSMTRLKLTMRSQPSPLVRSMTGLNLTMRSQRVGISMSGLTQSYF
jgi:hypothetical protein